MASDPFRGPPVTLGLIYKSGATRGPFNLFSSDAVEFALAFKNKDPMCRSETAVLKHRLGCAVVELHDLSTVTVDVGSVDAAASVVAELS